MPKHPRRPKDSADLARLVVEIASGEKPNDSFPVATPATKRGEARAAALTPKRRKAIAKKAAAARWKRKA
jgi:hypothetical protein